MADSRADRTIPSIRVRMLSCKPFLSGDWFTCATMRTQLKTAARGTPSNQAVNHVLRDLIQEGVIRREDRIRNKVPIAHYSRIMKGDIKTPLHLRMWTKKPVSQEFAQEWKYNERWA